MIELGMNADRHGVHGRIVQIPKVAARAMILGRARKLNLSNPLKCVRSRSYVHYCIRATDGVPCCRKHYVPGRLLRFKHEMGADC